MKHLIFFILITFSSVIYGQETSYICGSGSVTLTASASGGTAPYTYQWTSPSSVVTSGAVVTASASGAWYWNALDANGCAISGTHTIIIESDPTSGITINANNVCIGTAQTISATGVPSGYTYSWDFGSGANPTTSTSPTESVSYSTSGTKTITLTIERTFTGSTNGCSETCTWVKTKTITVGQLTGQSTCN